MSVAPLDGATKGTLLTLLLAISTGLELIILLRPRTIFASVHRELYDRSHTLSFLIDEAGRTNVGEISILGGTLLSFTDDARNLDALKQLDDKKTNLRILLMDFEGDAYGIEAAQRNRALYRKQGDYNLRWECARSVERLCDQLGQGRAFQCVRLYSAMPTTSVYRLGKVYVLTCYVFGHGGSSPSLKLERSAGNDAFCHGLDQGFDDLWKESRLLDHQSLQAAKQSSAPDLTAQSELLSEEVEGGA